MTNFLDPLYWYEIAMLVLGVVLFFVLVITLLKLVNRGKPFGSLLLFFAIPVVMIGYPTIQSVSFEDGVVTITKTTALLQKDPANTTLRQTLQQAVKKTALRPATNPRTMAKIAAGQFALGDRAAAEAKLKIALQQSPHLPAAVALQRKIAADDGVTTLDRDPAGKPTNETQGTKRPKPNPKKK
jgi:hypothetical protein